MSVYTIEYLLISTEKIKPLPTCLNTSSININIYIKDAAATEPRVFTFIS